MRILNIDSELFHSFTDSDNIQYDLFYSSDNKNGMVRVRDLDAQETISLKKYPSLTEAENAYNKLVREVKKRASLKNRPGETNYPGHGYSHEQRVNRYLYPAFKKIDMLLKEVQSFIDKDLPSANFGGDMKLRKEVYNLLKEVLKNTKDVYEIFKEYKTPAVASFISSLRRVIAGKLKVSYLHVLATTFKQNHHEKMGDIQTLANEIWAILLNARTYIPPERYREAKETIAPMIQDIKDLVTLINKY